MASSGRLAADVLLLGVPCRVGNPARSDHPEPLLDGRHREAPVPVRFDFLSQKDQSGPPLT